MARAARSGSAPGTCGSARRLRSAPPASSSRAGGRWCRCRVQVPPPTGPASPAAPATPRQADPCPQAEPRPTRSPRITGTAVPAPSDFFPSPRPCAAQPGLHYPARCAAAPAPGAAQSRARCMLGRVVLGAAPVAGRFLVGCPTRPREAVSGGDLPGRQRSSGHGASPCAGGPAVPEWRLRPVEVAEGGQGRSEEPCRVAFIHRFWPGLGSVYARAAALGLVATDPVSVPRSRLSGTQQPAVQRSPKPLPSQNGCLWSVPACGSRCRCGSPSPHVVWARHTCHRHQTGRWVSAVYHGCAYVVSSPDLIIRM